MKTGKPPRFQKYAVPGGLLFSTIGIAAVWYLDMTGWTTHGNTTTWIQQHRSDIQAVISVVSAALAALQVLTVTTLCNFHCRLTLKKDYVSLDTLKFWNALSTHSPSWNLPKVAKFITVAAFIFLKSGPRALWTGSLTPVQASRILLGQAPVPLYSNDPDGVYYNRTWDPFSSANTTRNELGSFSFVPAVAFSGALLGTAASATNVNGSARIHVKDDNSQYSYLGRSFGMGASVGLYDPVRRQSGALQSVFNETGYMAEVSCIINRTSTWEIALAYESADWTYPNLYDVMGHLPNTASDLIDHYSTVGLVTSSNLCHVLSKCAHGTCMLAIATYDYYNLDDVKDVPTSYAALNQAQCEVKFVPTVFNVSADHELQLITVLPNLELSAEDIDPTSGDFGPGLGRLAQLAMSQPLLLSMINTNLYTSLYGNALLRNIYNYQDANNRSGEAISDDETAAAVAESVSAMIDDILLYISSAMLVTGPGQDSTTVSLISNGFKIGGTGYILATIILNLCLALVWLSLCCYTRFWYALPKWDYREIENVIESSFLGGAKSTKRTQEPVEGALPPAYKLLGGEGVPYWLQRQDDSFESQTVTEYHNSYPGKAYRLIGQD